MSIALERRANREAFRHGWRKPQADRSLPEYAEKGTPDYERIVAEAKRLPAEFFMCKECNSGPWHITYGRCPNC